jgi:hypothetical protein
MEATGYSDMLVPISKVNCFESTGLNVHFQQRHPMKNGLTQYFTLRAAKYSSERGSQFRNDIPEKYELNQQFTI